MTYFILLLWLQVVHLCSSFRTISSPALRNLAPNPNPRQFTPLQVAKGSSRKESISLYNENLNLNTQFNITNAFGSFNSTTMRALFSLSNDMNSFWMRIENAFVTLSLRFASKVERDVSTTTKVMPIIASNSLTA